MPNEASNPGLPFLQNLLKAAYQNQDVNLLLQQNLHQLNDDFACLLRKWAIEQFKNQPNTAINLAKLIFKFSNIIQQFEQGDKNINLQIAILGYETSLKVCTYETCPSDWAKIQQALSEAYQQRQQILSNVIIDLKSEIEKHQTNINSISKNFSQELEKTQQQVEQLTTQLTELKPESVNLEQNEDIKNLIADYKDLKQSQSIIHQILINKDYASLTKQNFNTAVFYDIENLTMGRSNCNLNFSLRLIQDNLRKIDIVQKASVQCAYANWSDGRLKFLRKEIQELGIEPIQIFDFGHRKNAADIQLAIDAIELVNLRPNLEVFVIVSGDGAFASLAKKLHEYGKIVVGCAYERQANHFLKSVCDYFIPLIPVQETFTEKKQSEEKDNIFYYYTNENEIINSYVLVDIYNEAKENLLNLKDNENLRKFGIPISQIHNYLKKQISNFDERRLKANSSQLTKFLRKTIEGTEFSLSENNNKLILRESLLSSTES